MTSMTADCTHDSAAVKKHIGDFQSVGEQTAWVVAQVKDDAIGIGEFLQGISKFVRGIIRNESRKLNIAKVVFEQFGRDGVNGDFLTGDRNRFLGVAGVSDCDLYW